MGSSSEDTLNQLGDALVQTASLGLIGLEEGKIKKGVTLRGADEALGEITGRNAARKATMEAKDALAEEKNLKAEQLKEEQTRAMRQDISASQTAGALRASAQARAKLALGNPTTDFLGL